MRALLLPLLIAIALPTSAQPDPARDAAFAETADRIIAQAFDEVGAVPGLAVAVVRGGETVYARGFGYADVERSLPVTADTPFYIASATKPFTALLAALLDRDGLLALDASLASLFPDVAFDPAIEADSVTVRQLLAHVSGVENGPIGFRAAYTGQHTPAEMRRLLARSAPNAEAPRGQFDYTNVGYNIVSLRMDELSGGPWQTLLADRLFAPLGMTHTTAYASAAEAWAPARPYTPGPDGRPERIALVKHDDTMQAAGGLYASAADLARWLRLQLGGGRLDGVQMIPADVLDETHRPVAADRGDAFGPFGRDGYALGWHTGRYDGEPVLHHFGGFAGFHTHLSFMPDRDLGVVVLANESGAGGRLALLLAGFAYDWWSASSTEGDAVAERTLEGAAALRSGFDRYLAHGAREAAQRAERTWQLSLPAAAYAGTYADPDSGTLVVEHDPEAGLAVRFGRLQSAAEPFTDPESARVELIPGRGEGIRFELEGGQVRALVYVGQRFARL